MSELNIEQAFRVAVEHHQAGHLAEAEEFYRQILSRQPAHAGALHYLGVVATQTGHHEIAVDLIRQAIIIEPANPQAYNNLGAALESTGLLDEAIAAYQKTLDLDDHVADAWINLGHVLRTVGRLDDAIAAYRRATELAPHTAEPHSHLLYAIHFHPACDARAIADEHRRWGDLHAPRSLSVDTPHTNRRDPERRLRVGYVSPHLRDHVVGHNLLPLLAHHRRDDFEIFAYAETTAEDWCAKRLRALTDCWRGTVGLDDNHLAKQIRRDQIDILVDLALHMPHNRLGVFARRPAPVQVTFAGYPSGTGTSAIDYRLSDPYLDPVGADDTLYRERTIRIPN